MHVHPSRYRDQAAKANPNDCHTKYTEPDWQATAKRAGPSITHLRRGSVSTIFVKLRNYVALQWEPSCLSLYIIRQGPRELLGHISPASEAPEVVNISFVGLPSPLNTGDGSEIRAADEDEY